MADINERSAALSADSFSSADALQREVQTIDAVGRGNKLWGPARVRLSLRDVIAFFSQASAGS